MVTYRSRGAADPRAQDARARSLNVDDGTVVGVAGLRVVLVGGTDCADRGLRSRGVVRSVGVVVASGNGKENTRVDEGRCGVVDGGRVAAAQGHVGDRAVGAAPGGHIIGDEVDAGNDARARSCQYKAVCQERARSKDNGVDIRGAGTIRAQNLDGIELGLLGNTIGARANGTSNMGAMAVAIRVGAVGEVRGEGSTPAELLSSG